MDEKGKKPAAKKPNSVTAGSQPIWPVLRPTIEGVVDHDDVARALADRIKAGDHDDVLTELLVVEQVHDRRAVVLDALRGRHKTLELDLPPKAG